MGYNYNLEEAFKQLNESDDEYNYEDYEDVELLDLNEERVKFKDFISKLGIKSEGKVNIVNDNLVYYVDRIEKVSANDIYDLMYEYDEDYIDFEYSSEYYGNEDPTFSINELGEKRIKAMIQENIMDDLSEKITSDSEYIYDGIDGGLDGIDIKDYDFWISHYDDDYPYIQGKCSLVYTLLFKRADGRELSY